jgi:nitroimidazol reductase NimA-like FMN-containing flavoprotein (pyridoxamine 5'-phosphate oxidase superfamily)
VKVDSAGLEVLEPSECLALAGTMPIGRVVFTDRALPAVEPVNFVLDDGCVILRTAEGSRLAAALRGTIVAFETDDYDARAESGWSVTVVGRAEPVVDATESARLARLPQTSWVSGSRPWFIRIRPEHITGRRIIVAPRPNGRRHPDGDGRSVTPGAVEAG